jgi:RNA polymerase sigma factor (sigma-70 family)
VEASALQAPASLTRLTLPSPLLRLRSDEQLVALFRGGSDEAFRVLHDRYRQRLFAYVRQMLSAAPRQDAEDVLQDVFVRAFRSLRDDQRDLNVRAWLYRVAHNRCIDHLRRPVPPPAEIFELSRKPLHDPLEEAARREQLARLVTDVGRLPQQQRSALLMREIDGMSYADLASALDVTVPAVKSLLVRARVGLAEAQEARDTDCREIRDELTAAYDRGVKAPGRAKRHMRECDGCREYRSALRGVRSSFAALAPVGAGPLAMVAKLLGLGGAGGGAAAAGGAGASAVAGGSGIAALAGSATACKVAAVVCATALTAGSAVEVHKLADHAPRHVRHGAATTAANGPVAARAATAPIAPAALRMTAPAAPHRAGLAAAGAGAATAADGARAHLERRAGTALPAAGERTRESAPDLVPPAPDPDPAAAHSPVLDAAPPPVTGGTPAPGAPDPASRPGAPGSGVAPAAGAAPATTGAPGPTTTTPGQPATTTAAQPPAAATGAGAALTQAPAGTAGASSPDPAAAAPAAAPGAAVAPATAAP